MHHMSKYAHPDGVEREALSLSSAGAAAGAICDLREGALQHDMFLVIHDVHTRPVHGYDDLILRETGT